MIYLACWECIKHLGLSAVFVAQRLSDVRSNGAGPVVLCDRHGLVSGIVVDPPGTPPKPPVEAPPHPVG